MIWTNVLLTSLFTALQPSHFLSCPIQTTVRSPSCCFAVTHWHYSICHFLCSSCSQWSVKASARVSPLVKLFTQVAHFAVTCSPCEREKTVFSQRLTSGLWPCSPLLPVTSERETWDGYFRNNNIFLKVLSNLYETRSTQTSSIIVLCIWFKHQIKLF